MALEYRKRRKDDVERVSERIFKVLQNNWTLHSPILEFEMEQADPVKSLTACMLIGLSVSEKTLPCEL